MPELAPMVRAGRLVITMAVVEGGIKLTLIYGYHGAPHDITVVSGTQRPGIKRKLRRN